MTLKFNRAYVITRVNDCTKLDGDPTEGTDTILPPTCSAPFERDESVSFQNEQSYAASGLNPGTVHVMFRT